MNVKSIDIARALGISKSTVSLALNGKPGVSEQTRQEVLACKKQLEEHGAVPPGMFSRQPEQRKRQQIKIVKITNGMKNIQGLLFSIKRKVEMKLLVSVAVISIKVQRKL